MNGDGSVDRSEFETTCRQLGDVLAALAGPAEEAAASPALQVLRDQTQAVLAELEAAKPSTAAAGTTSLPDGLKDFTPLAKEPEIAAIAAGLHELELAVARNPASEAALVALRAETEKLALATQAKIDTRTAEARWVPTAEEMEAMWTELMPRVLEKERERFHGPEEFIAEGAQRMVDPLQAAWEKAWFDDKRRLLREAKKEHFPGEEQSIVPLISECAAVILAGNRDFQKIYHAVYDVVRSGEADGIKAAQAAITALGQAVRGDPKLLQQRDEAAETVTLFADAAGARPAFAELVQCLSEATGARLEMASPGERDGLGREQTGLKATKRVVEKAALRPGEGRGRTDRVCDVVRAMLVAKDMRTIGAIAEALRALQAAGLIEVRRIKDRFTQPSGGGWRDLMVNLVVLDGDGAVQHVCEVQVAHEMMLTARKGLPGHEVYAVQRNAVEFIESCGLEAELRRAMVQALKKEGKTHAEILSEFEDGWILEDLEWAAAVGSKEALLKVLEAGDEGRLAKVQINRSVMTSLPESVGDCKGLQTIVLHECEGLLSLPERLDECTALKTLRLKGCTGLLSLPERLGGCKGLQTLSLDECTGLLSLPERLGECTALQTLRLSCCSGLLSLPERLGECKGLQELHLFACPGLLSLPDLAQLKVEQREAGLLAQLLVEHLPGHLQPWKDSGYKAFSFAAWLDAQIDEGTLTELTSWPSSLTSLPERLGELKTLQTLSLDRCSGLLSLPERLGELKTLQTLSLAGCFGCEGLLSLPDLSGLAQLKVNNLPDNLQPWADSGYKAFSLVNVRRCKYCGEPGEDCGYC